MKLDELMILAKESENHNVIYSDWYVTLMKKIINKPELGLYIGSSHSSYMSEYPEELRGLCQYLYHKSGTEYRDQIVNLISNIIKEYESGSSAIPNSIWAYHSDLPFISVIPIRLFSKSKLNQINY